LRELSAIAVALGLEKDASETKILTEIARLRAASDGHDLLFHSMVEHLPAMIFVKDAASLRFVHFNRAGELLLGTSRKAMLGRSDYDFFPEHEADAFTAKDREVLAAGGVHDIPEEPIHTPAGVRWLHTQKIPIHDSSGIARFLLGISTDVTEERAQRHALAEVQAEVRAQAEQLRLLLDGFPGAIWTTDGEFRITSIEGGLASRLELDQCIGQDVRQLPVASVGAEGGAPAHVAAMDGQATRYELQTSDGPVEVWVHPLKGAGVMSVAMDITERRASEAQRLQSRVERGQRLETLGLLAGGIAHDFNNLLGIILGSASIARGKAPEGSALHGTLERIELAATTGAELTRQMLAYSGRGSFVVEVAEISGIVSEISDLLRVSVDKNATLQLDLHEGALRCRIDVAQVRQVVLNLVTNASDAIRQEPGTITIRTGMVEADAEYLATSYLGEDLAAGRYAFVEVSDTGAGMDADTQNRMFDPFFTMKEAGHGLGLAATLGIVRGHGGTLRVFSQLGQGTSVRVLLPVVDAPVSQPRGQQASGADHAPSGTVLVVDDEPAMRLMIAEGLRGVGYEVVEAENGDACLAIIDAGETEVDLILLDMTMPGMNGRETFAALRERGVEAPVLLSSGYSQDDASLEDGIAGFIHKPYRIADLKARVDALIAPPA
jgi:PAS domain S-box-containing protein